MSESVSILVVGRDRKFRALVRAELREAGYDALGLETLDEAGDLIARAAVKPAAFIFDLTECENPARGLEIVASLARFVPVLLIASHSNPPPATSFPAGVAVLFRPLSVGDVVTQVRAQLEKRPA